MSDEFEVMDGEGGALATTPSGGALAAIVRSEVDAQLSAAHKFPRSVGKALSTAKTLATHTPRIAESCGYLLERWDSKEQKNKPIVGPSVRLAEIVASSWGNIRVDARVIEDTGTEIVARGSCWDLENNLQASTEIRRSVMTSSKYGKEPKRFSGDLISVVANAACSIARRNAILQVVPRSVVEDVYAAAMDVAKGTGLSMEQRRSGCIKAFSVYGVSETQILRKLGRASLDDVTDDDLDVLVALRSMLKSGEITPAQAFAVEADLEPVSASSVIQAAAAKRGPGRPRKEAQPVQMPVQATIPDAAPPAPIVRPVEAPVVTQAAVPDSWEAFCRAVDALATQCPTHAELQWAYDYMEDGFKAMSRADRAAKIAKLTAATAALGG